MNRARLVGIDINDEELVRFEIQATRGNATARAIIDHIADLERLRARAACAVWDRGRPPQAEVRTEPINERREENLASNIIPFPPRSENAETPPPDVPVA